MLTGTGGSPREAMSRLSRVPLHTRHKKEPSYMSTLLLSVAVATFLCAVTTGMLVVFSVVVMPGIGSLPDRDYLQAFKVMDRIIQENDARFIGIWVGSIVSVLMAAIGAIGSSQGLALWLIAGAAVIWVLLVQVPTVMVNIPLNNTLQRTEIDTLSQRDAAEERLRFESRWVFWNGFRTVAGLVASAMLLVALINLTQ